MNPKKYENDSPEVEEINTSEVVRNAENFNGALENEVGSNSEYVDGANADMMDDAQAAADELESEGREEAADEIRFSSYVAGIIELSKSGDQPQTLAELKELLSDNPEMFDKAVEAVHDSGMPEEQLNEALSEIYGRTSETPAPVENENSEQEGEPTAVLEVATETPADQSSSDTFDAYHDLVK